MTTVYEALNGVMRDVREVRKASENKQQGFMFRGIDAVVNAVGPALRDHGVIVTPTVQAYEYGTVEVGNNRTRMAHVRVTVTYSFYGPEGDAIYATTIGEAMDSGDKATAKAMSVAFRIALLQALALPTDEPDPDASSYERSRAADAPPDTRPVMSPEKGAEYLHYMADALDEATLRKYGAQLTTFQIDDALRALLSEAWSSRLTELRQAKAGEPTPADTLPADPEPAA